MPLLTIGIPTYNREYYLKESLENIINQEGFNENDIEIIISDNASNDNTKALGEYYQLNFKNIRYFRNDKNLGADNNILNVVEKSNGEYVWLMGDDDKILKGGLNYIYNTIKQNGKIGVYLLNYNFNNKPIIKSIEKDLLFSNSKNYIKIISKFKPTITEMDAFKMTFLSSLIINREEWNKVNNKKKYIGTGLLHTYIILDFILNNPIYFLSKSFIKQNNIPFRGDITIPNETLLALKWCKIYFKFAEVFKSNYILFSKLIIFFFLLYIYRKIKYFISLINKLL